MVVYIKPKTHGAMSLMDSKSNHPCSKAWSETWSLPLEGKF